jgi:hypothetical protein
MKTIIKTHQLLTGMYIEWESTPWWKFFTRRKRLHELVGACKIFQIILSKESNIVSWTEFDEDSEEYIIYSINCEGKPCPGYEVGRWDTNKNKNN